ncbi:MAG: ATP-binding protein [Lutibacter sp.]|jgi:PAS domain S-box-containing protein
MKESILIGLLQNAALLIAFSMLYQNFWIRNEGSKSISGKIIAGLVLSSIGIILMSTPWIYVPGISFDMRSVLLSVSGLFFGLIPTVMAMLVTGIVRIAIGGEGVWMGLVVILFSGSIGLLWRKFRPNWKTNNYYIELLVMGLTVHIVMLACIIFLPSDEILPTLKVIIIPLLIIYPPISMLLGILMVNQYKNWQNELAQLKLQESERRFSQILNSGNIVTLMLNNDGSVHFCNDYLLQIIGYEKEEILGKNWFDLFVPNTSKEKLLALFAESLKTGFFSENNENEILTKNGELLCVLWYNIVLKSETDEVIGTAGVGVNITESKIQEKMLKEKNIKIKTQNEEYKKINFELKKAKEQAEESDRLKSAFLANMSHEIRTPMSGILGFADLLKSPELTRDKRYKYIEIIEKSGRRMLNIINDIVSISKIESGQSEISISETNINEQLEYIYSFFKPETDKKGIQLILNNTLSAKEAVFNTDKEKICAILTNLVKNAIKFTSQGIIEIGCNLKGNSEPAELEFYVKDTGEGISEEQKELIFERFRQGSDSLTRNYEGAGLGLAISKAYVEMLGGKIWVESENGMGAVFYFTIPEYVKK